MPRSTAKCRQNVNGSYSNTIQNIDEKPSNVMAPKENAPSTRRRTAVKKERPLSAEADTKPMYQGGSRKSERRRVARDIFLVFEEQPSARRSRGSNKKQQKPKFGHLKVEEPVKSKTLLRDIKNEPKCYLGDNILDSAHQQMEKDDTKKKIVNTGAKSTFKIWSSASSKTHCSVYSSINSVDNFKLQQEVTKPTDDAFQIAKVNPIFLWAKQDNTRIIEVRCEDYDKRNRIRITKTSNGWRAMPRSDPSSSKVLKLYTTPLIKVKHETNIQENNNISQTASAMCNLVNKESKPVVESEHAKQDITQEPIDVGIQVSGIDCMAKPTTRKSKKKKAKKRKRVFTCKKATIKINVSGVEESGPASEKDIVESVENPNELVLLKEDFRNACGPISEISIENTCKIADIAEESINKATSSLIEETFTMEHVTYQNTSDDDNSLHLCPKTGLFLRTARRDNDVSEVVEVLECNNDNDSDMLEQKTIALDIKPNPADDNNESLEAKTRNLKDLLDDADLFQHCDDNANCDADLIDTLVKSSCENNLIQGSETNAKVTADNMQTKTMTGNNMVVVNEPPKCLSFNEAGEIEALNCELFHPSDEFIDSFVEKQPSTTIIDTGMPSINETGIAMVQSHNAVRGGEPTVSNDKVLENNSGSIHIIEDSPKDLSYKKREEVCPPSESRSQCAVTSSSDIVKSPNLDESTGLASSSETLKNLILEQFMKLNTISGHQKHSVDSDKQSNTSHINSSYTESKEPSAIIETVVIEDSDSANEDNQANVDEEPLKKRLRSNALPSAKVVNEEYVKSKMVMIDKDPDPLTQLQLLIRNSQWKVPDPILVPKDRLSAVLASPAREIPLLITTRPELRLPEAFAYPEIIQNPNILVISMAQLEAILKNDVEAAKSKTNELVNKPPSKIFPQDMGKNTKYIGEFVDQDNSQSHKSTEMHPQTYRNEEVTPEKSKSMTLVASKGENSKCSHIDSSLSTDINAATMAVLNQMLWLPYFGQISQEFMKSIKTPHNFTQTVPSISPKVNNADMDSRCHGNRNQQAKIPGSNDNQSFSSILANAAVTSMLKQGQTEEMNLFQKIVQQQMQNVMNLTQSKNPTDTVSNSSANASHAYTIEQCSYPGRGMQNFSKTDMTHNKTQLTPQQKSKDLGHNNNHTGDTTKIYNLRSSIASRQTSDFNQCSNSKRTNVDNKPRLTCKSLSNLIDPEHKQPQNINSSANLTTPCVPNVDPSFHHAINDIKDQSTENSVLTTTPVVDHSLPNTINKQFRDNVRNMDTMGELNKHKNKIVENARLDHGSRGGDTASLSAENNIPLWHPLFGSNSKPVSYNSPWQWTTVTAAGE
ncbi:uncharacterized protein [Musca autumnalis]|uniref:uncharacterized protein n=1 Tax=Musca autumnalis TaxID=221902 RepID=UPI003CE8A31A